jgi:hypothetical protein
VSQNEAYQKPEPSRSAVGSRITISITWVVCASPPNNSPYDEIPADFNNVLVNSAVPTPRDIPCIFHYRKHKSLHTLQIS